jgi:hypothetical protein
MHARREALFALAAPLGIVLAGACATASSPLAAKGGDGGSGGQDGTGGASGTGIVGSGGGKSGGGGGPTIVDAGGADGDAAKDVAVVPEAAPFDAAPDVYVDLDGPPELRFLHGFADAPTVRACLVPWGDTGPLASPVAMPSMDLPYGAVVTLAPPAGADPAGAFRVVAVGGDLSKVGASSCQALLEMPIGGVFVAPLVVLPPQTLTAPRSLLVVGDGCVGGYVLGDATTACGTAGAPAPLDGGATGPDKRTAGAVVVEVSRVAPPSDQMGFQVLHASATLAPLGVRVVPMGGGTPVMLTQGLTLGAIAPHPPLAVSPQVAFGIIPAQSQIVVGDMNGDLFGVGVGDALATSGVDVGEIAPGKGFVLVVVGPKPSPLDAGLANPGRVVWLRQPLISPPLRFFIPLAGRG